MTSGPDPDTWAAGVRSRKVATGGVTLGIEEILADRDADRR
jgi:hypothetical protein